MPGASVQLLIPQPFYTVTADILLSDRHCANLTILVLPSRPEVLKKQSKPNICPFEQRPVDEPLDALFTGCRAGFWKRRKRRWCLEYG